MFFKLILILEVGECAELFAVFVLLVELLQNEAKAVKDP